MKRQVRKVEWLVSVKESRNIEVVEGLVVMMVESVAAAKLVLVNMTKEEKDSVERAKAGVARDILGVGKRVSKRAVLRELGWETTWSVVVKAKLGMMGRLLRLKQEEDETVVVSVKARKAQVERGDRRGVMGECYGLILKYGGEEWVEKLWGERAEEGTKGRYKRDVKDFVKVMEKERGGNGWRRKEGGENWCLSGIGEWEGGTKLCNIREGEKEVSSNGEAGRYTL